MAKIDWLTLSWPNGSFPAGQDEGLHALAEFLGVRPKDIRLVGGKAGRAPFTRSLHTSHADVYYNHAREGLVIEFTGQHCSLLGQEALLSVLTQSERITRIDLAHDFAGSLPDNMPYDEKCGGILKSSSGVTLYYGSPKSDWMTRCYEYFPPHERAGCWRVEHVLRRSHAMRAKDLILGGQLDALHATYSVKRALPAHAMTMDNLSVLNAAANRSRDQSTTLAWMTKQVKPAIDRLLAEGVSAQAIAEALGII